MLSRNQLSYTLTPLIDICVASSSARRATGRSGVSTNKPSRTGTKTCRLHAPARGHEALLERIRSGNRGDHRRSSLRLLQWVRVFAYGRIRATGSIALEDAQVAHAHPGGPHPPNLAELVLDAESGEQSRAGREVLHKVCTSGDAQRTPTLSCTVGVNHCEPGPRGRMSGRASWSRQRGKGACIATSH